LVVEDGDEEREKKGVEDVEDMEAGTSRSTPLRIHRSMSESSYASSGTDAVGGGWWSVIDVCVCVWRDEVADPLDDESSVCEAACSFFPSLGVVD
jgi:hypothetical protein